MSTFTPSEASLAMVDAPAFVRDAERATNAYDVDALVGVYAASAQLEVIVDGARETYAGASDIRRAWVGYAAGMRKRCFQVRKRLLAASADTLTNAWEGQIGTAHLAAGI